jgi:outer membrane immunogenic protein
MPANGVAMKFATALAALALTTATASAADLGPRTLTKAEPVPSTAYSWTGVYVGLNGGYGWSRGDIKAVPGDPNSQAVGAGQQNVPLLSASQNASGWLAGAQAGYDWQFATRGVVGIEADIAAADLKSSASAPTVIFFGSEPAAFAANRSIDRVGTVRGRIGLLATPDLLLYATGGFAYGKVNESATVSLTTPGISMSSNGFGYAYYCGPFFSQASCFAGSSSRIATGWAAGVGGEQRFTRNLSLKVEYLHVDLGSASYRLAGSLAAGAPFTPGFLNASSSATIDMVRAGLNYRF